MTMPIAIEPPPLRPEPDGTIRVGGTRVTLDTVIASFRAGATPEQIAQQYPSVPLADIYAVIGYYLHHTSDVEAYLADRRRQADETRREMESHFDPAGVRDRLISRGAA